LFISVISNYFVLYYGDIDNSANRETKRYFQICGIGDLSLLPPSLQTRIKEIEEYTKHNTAGVFNVCFSYSATNEITSGVKKLVHERLHHPATTDKLNESIDLSENLQPIGDEMEQDISELDMERVLQTFGSPDIDLLVRTSGEIRLSDFMLWQSTASCLLITEVLWPEFSPRHLYAAVLYYQEHYDSLKVRFL
jgi:ditrans,polycis-polyprenyl diphosphate synthase